MQFVGGMAGKCFLLALVLGLVLTGTAQAQIYGPKFRIVENVYCDYDTSGDETGSSLSRTGSMYVSVPNNDDVLQYLRVTLDSGYDTNTNLENETVYHDVVVSYPNADDYEIIYVNTSAAQGGSEAAETSYTITDAIPTINLSMEYKNVLGGNDLYDERNIADPDNDYYLNLTVTNPSSTAMSGARAYIYFERDVNDDGNDIEVASVEDYGVGTATPRNYGDGSQNDGLDWVGITIPASSSINLTIHLNITSGVHLSNLDTIDLDLGDEGPVADEGVNITWASTSALFSELTVADKFSRGPVRQGVDLSSNAGFWYTRGFIRNMGDAAGASEHNLTYNISEWRIYDVNAATGAPQNVLQYGEFNQSSDSCEVEPGDGRIYTTNDSRSSNTTLYNSSSSTKPYMAVYFEWEVIWNSTNSETNVTSINSTLDLPTLYLVDLTLDQTATGTISPEVGGENVTINETLVNVGHDYTNPSFTQILSYVPSNTTNDDWRGSGWDIDNSVLVYINDTYQIDPDPANCVLTVTDPTETTEGLVNLTIYSLASCTLSAGGLVGHILDENQNVIISYVVTSDVAMTTGDQYEFYSIGQLNSSSGTEDREYCLANQTVSVSGKRLTGYKDLIGYDNTMPTMINSSIKVEVADDSGTGITGIKFIDYVPANTISYGNYVGNASVYFYDGSETTWNLNDPGEYQITDNGTAKTPDGLNVQMFEFVNATGNSTWNLTDGQYIRVSYQINFTSAGLYVLPVTIAAFDPDTGLDIGATFYGTIKIVLPDPSLPLVIEQGELEQSKTVLVGKPVIWNKEFDIFNPNARTVNTRFQTTVFDDASDGYVSYYDENGRRIEEPVGFSTGPGGEKVMHWDTALAPLENRNYEVTVLTPPVLEIDRDVEVLEQLPEKKVRLKMDVYLKSFAKENYENIILNLPIAYSKIEEVRDGFGNRIPFTGGADTTSITVDRMTADELKTVTIIYVESYPTIIITPDRDRYNLNSPVSLEILVINGGEDIDYPFLEIEIYTPGMDVIFSDISRLESMEPLEKTQTYQKFVIPASAPSGNYIAQAKFREDFAVLASATGNFYVAGVGGGIPGAIEVIMIILVLAVLGYFSFRRLREVRKSSSPYGRL